jgi:hypothetical protein
MGDTTTSASRGRAAELWRSGREVAQVEESSSSGGGILCPVPWSVWLCFCLTSGAVAGWLALGRAADSAAGVVIFAAIGAALLTPWQVLHHRLLSWGKGQANFKTKLIRVSTVLGIAIRNGFGGWILGSIVSALVPWSVPGTGPVIRIGLGMAFGVVLGTIYRALPGPGDRFGVARGGAAGS